MKEKNERKRAVVMGASSGMGLEVARRLLGDGWHVALAARRTEPMEKLKEEFPLLVDGVRAIDVTQGDAPQQLLRLIEELGGMDLYFHSSGIGRQNMELDASTEEQTMMTNAVGFTRLIDTAFNYFAGHGGGHIAAITSIAGTKGLGAAPAYSATKSLQGTYLQALEQQARMRRLDIRITDIRPGFVDTPLLGDGRRYPMLIKPEKAARQIMDAVYRQRHVRIIDGRYRVLVALWRLIPNWAWRKMGIRN